MSERKTIISKRKHGSVSFTLETDDGSKTYYVLKMTCLQVSQWMDFVRENSKEIIDSETGKKNWMPKSAVNWKETLLSLAVVDNEYRPLSIEHFNDWTQDAVEEAYKLADSHNFSEMAVEKKES